MKLGEALTERARLQQKLNTLRQRVVSNAYTQEGTKPDVNPEHVLGELESTMHALESLIIRINTTNVTATLETGETIMQALAHRDALGTKLNTLNQVIEAQPDTNNYRYMRTELRSVSHVDVSSLYRQVDATSKLKRELDARIQAANWATDLVE